MSPESESVMSYGCQYACGNAYSVILLQVTDGSSLYLCIPCFVRTAIEIVKAMTEGLPPEVQETANELAAMQADMTPGPTAKRGRHNAPVGNDSPELIEAFDTRVYEDELGDEFK